LSLELDGDAFRIDEIDGEVVVYSLVCPHLLGPQIRHKSVTERLTARGTVIVSTSVPAATSVGRSHAAQGGSKTVD
jgi:hypothetical protein